MCIGFGGFYSKAGKVYFTMCDEAGDYHHGRTAEAMGEVADVVPFEVSKWTAKSFEWHDCDVPGWITDKDKQAILKVMRGVRHFVKKYKKVTVPARAEYKKVRDTAWAELEEQLKQIDGYVD